MMEALNNRIAILGGGESGVGAAILAKDKGFDVFLSDAGNLKQGYRETLIKESIDFEEGGHTPAKILSAALVIKSPGVPPTAPMIKEIVENSIPVISEIEFAGRFTNSKMVCITGSNGKTTTTLLTFHILKKAGLDVGLAGNVGKSLAYQVSRDPHEFYVIELSSFQLENMYDFKAHIAVMMNITPDHLDRYDYKMQNYIDAKFRIVNNMTHEDAFVYWENDPVITKQLENVEIEARMLPFAERRESEKTAAWVDEEEMLIVRNDLCGGLQMPRSDLALNGLHNLYNSMAAGISACVLNIRKDSIREALSDFNGVEHRLESVRTLNGVRFINDSKATNVNSCWYALECMPKGKQSVILILGGKDKGNDYTEIFTLVKEKVKNIIALGKDNKKIIDTFGSFVEVTDTHSMEDAVKEAFNRSTEGDTVLLSPCCASFDIFNSYEHRGDEFKKFVRNL